MFLFLVFVLLAPIELRKEYFCHGTTVNGKYDVILNVEKKEDNYLLTWRTTEIKAKGIGVRDGNSLAALFVNPQSQGGVILYRITKGGLEGFWAMGSGKVYTETCTLGPASKA